MQSGDLIVKMIATLIKAASLSGQCIFDKRLIYYIHLSTGREHGIAHLFSQVEKASGIAIRIRDEALNCSRLKLNLGHCILMCALKECS